MKTCTKCGFPKDDNEFYLDERTQKRIAACRSCCYKRSKLWKKQHPKQRKGQQNRRNKRPVAMATRQRWIKANHGRYMAAIKRHQVKLRMEALIAYGGNPPRCACQGCCEANVKFLTIDHKNGDGAAHRRKIAGKPGGRDLYRWLRKQNYPPGFQVLCYNCNCAKRTGIACPHVSSSEPVWFYSI